MKNFMNGPGRPLSEASSADTSSTMHCAPVASASALTMPRIAGTVMGWFYVRQTYGAGAEVVLVGFFTGVGGDTMCALWQQRSWGPGNVLQGNLRKENGSLHGFGETGYLLPSGQWSHVGLTYDTAADCARIYINGDLLVESTGWISGQGLSYGGSNFYIGGYGYGNHHLSNTDDVRVFDVALTSAQVRLAMSTPV
jgi:hypothetical protein